MYIKLSISRHQNLGNENINIRIANRSFENVSQFKYLRMTVTNQNVIERRWNSGKVQNLLSSHLLSKNFKIKIYKTIILPVVLYGCETWCLTLREEHRLRVFENRMLRRIFGPKRDDVMREWRKLHKKELRDLYFSPSIIRKIKSMIMRWAGHVAQMGEKQNTYRLLVGKPEGRRPLERPIRRWVDNIRIELGEVGWSDVYWIGLVQGRNRWQALVNSVLNLWVP
jgi:hypothetical protein